MLVLMYQFLLLTFHSDFYFYWQAIKPEKPLKKVIKKSVGLRKELKSQDKTRDILLRNWKHSSLVPSMVLREVLT